MTRGCNTLEKFSIFIWKGPEATLDSAYTFDGEKNSRPDTGNRFGRWTIADLTLIRSSADSFVRTARFLLVRAIETKRRGAGRIHHGLLFAEEETSRADRAWHPFSRERKEMYSFCSLIDLDRAPLPISLFLSLSLSLSLPLSLSLTRARYQRQWRGLQRNRPQ